MTFGYACIECKQEFTIVGTMKENLDISQTVVKELNVTKENKHYKIKTVRCPFCGYVHTVQIDNKDTQALVKRIENLFIKKVIADDVGIETKKGKRLRKAFLDTNDALNKKRIILQGWADGQSFNIDDTNKQIIFKYIINIGDETHELKGNKSNN